MSISPEQLNLHESYNFDVIVEFESDRYSGKLSICPKNISFEIMCEESEERSCKIGWDNFDKMVCKTIDCYFILCELTFVNGQGRTISRYPKRLGFFEVKFNVEYVIFCPSDSKPNIDYFWIDIYSKTISKWIGHTETQENIINLSKDVKKLFDAPTVFDEFSTNLEKIGSLGVTYNFKMGSDATKFNSGIMFPPSLYIRFSYTVSEKTIKEYYCKLYALLFFLTGGELSIERIDIGYMKFDHSFTGSLYYPTESNHQKFFPDYPVLPLGHNLRLGQLNLPSTPVEVFSNYFSLDNKDISYWSKYLRYRRMGNSEERFLGYFRILESLSYKQRTYLDEQRLKEIIERATPFLVKCFTDRKNVVKFLKRLPHLNRSKYNTEKCIQDFYEILPASISSKWKFKKGDIGKICKLRNDITHANHYEGQEIEIFEKFVEVLLIFSMFLKIGMSIKDISKIIGRISGYHLIVNKDITMK